MDKPKIVIFKKKRIIDDKQYRPGMRGEFTLSLTRELIADGVVEVDWPKPKMVKKFKPRPSSPKPDITSEESQQ